jgi:hypothetical protein
MNRGSGLIDWQIIIDIFDVLSTSLLFSSAVLIAIFAFIFIGDFLTAVMHKLHSVFVPYRV